MKLRIITFLLLFLVACGGDNEVETKTEKHLLQVVTIPVENNTIAGYAFLIPDTWQGEGKVTFAPSTLISPLVTVDAKKPNSRLKVQGQNIAMYNYSESYAHTLDEIDRLALQSGVTSTMQRDPLFIPPIPIEAYFQDMVLPQLFSQYQVLSQERVDDFYIRPIPFERNTLKVNFAIDGRPNDKAILYLIQNIYRMGGDSVVWDTVVYSMEGPKTDEKEFVETAKLIANSIEINPIYSNYINRLNQQIIQNRKKNFAIMNNSIRGVSEHFSATLNAIQKQSDTVRSSLSEQTSDMMLDVTTYRNPTDGSEIKLPSENKFNYTNNLGDFLSTDNPFFDPNVGLTSHYNWIELQKKY